mgnify:CR=1 FL=1
MWQRSILAILRKIQNGRRCKSEHQIRTMNKATDACSTSFNRFLGVTNLFLTSKHNFNVTFKVKFKMAATKIIKNDGILKLGYRLVQYLI